MGKKTPKKTTAATVHLNTPMTPVIYLNDPSPDFPHARHLRDMIPSGVIGFLSPGRFPPEQDTNSTALEWLLADFRKGDFDDCVLVVKDDLTDSETADKIAAANRCHEETIKHGCNFASVNLYLEDGTPSTELKKWGTNHLELCVANLTVKEVVEKIYRWLFTVLSVQETLHLIPDSEMLAVDKRCFPEYAYCPISESKSRPKDAKIQFVAVIISKPVVGPNQRLQWTVADKTGTANFYFQYRGASSQHTWDWVQKLQPGDRKALPRMPMVEIKERKRVRIAKAPVRTVALLVSGVGIAIRGLGHGVNKLGEVAQLGKSAEWVPEADVVDGKKVNFPAVFEKEKHDRLVKIERSKKTIDAKVFNAQGEKVWKDDDSIASTTHGEEVVAEKVKEFC